MAKFKIPRPKSATKLLHTYDNILLDARTKWESATVDRQKLVEIIAAFEARTPDPSGRDPQIPDGWRVKLPKLACMDGETLLRNRTEQDGTFRLTQLRQLKAILDCITKDVEIKHAGIAQVRVTLASKLDELLLMPVQGKSELVEIATRHKAEVLAEFDKIGTKSLYDATQMQSARRTAAKKKRDEDVKVRGKADMEELDGELDRAKLLQQIAELRYERDDTSAPPGGDRLGEIQKKLTACENSVKALNKALNGRARPKTQAERAKKGKMTLKQKKAAKAKAAAKAAKKATVVSSSSAKPGGGNATKGAGKGKGKGKGGKGKPNSSGRGGGQQPATKKRKGDPDHQGKPAKKPKKRNRTP